jgi:hypothetical protein
MIKKNTRTKPFPFFKAKELPIKLPVTLNTANKIANGKI